MHKLCTNYALVMHKLRTNYALVTNYALIMHKLCTKIPFLSWFLDITLISGERI